MALSFEVPYNSDLRVAVDLNSDGNIAMAGETPAGQKNFTCKYFSTTDNSVPSSDGVNLNTSSNAESIISGLMRIICGTYTASTLRQTITRKVVES